MKTFLSTERMMRMIILEENTITNTLKGTIKIKDTIKANIITKRIIANKDINITVKKMKITQEEKNITTKAEEITKTEKDTTTKVIAITKKEKNTRKNTENIPKEKIDIMMRINLFHLFKMQLLIFSMIMIWMARLARLICIWQVLNTPLNMTKMKILIVI